VTRDDAFLQAIIESPDDDTPRLVYADWLEEHGQPDRAALIRVQCRLACLADDDPTRPDLEAVERRLLEGHQGAWVVQCGLPMTWENALAVFRQRLHEAAAWCCGRSGSSLRTPSLDPRLVLWEPATPGRPRAWRGRPPTGEWQAMVNGLANRRARLLAGEGRHPRVPASHLGRGRLLLFDPDCTLSDGAAEASSGGFFDIDNVPAWDTWVWGGPEQPGSWPLVAWVPRSWVDRADAGVRVNAEGCIRWADDVETTLTRHLRAAGLLG
jgi:uncharacterized protein (TIGR02996 family)